MTPDEVNLIAAAVCAQIKADQPSFFIPAEAHYNSHKNMDDLVADWKLAKSIFWKAFIGLAMLGMLALSAVGGGYHR